MKKLDKIYEINGSRKDDFISIIAISMASVIIFFLIKKNFYQPYNQSGVLLYLSMLTGFISIFMGYFEARSDDPFVTGKKVYSEEKLSFGDIVQIIYLRGTYLYVEKVLDF